MQSHQGPTYMLELISSRAHRMKQSRRAGQAGFLLSYRFLHLLFLLLPTAACQEENPQLSQDMSHPSASLQKTGRTYYTDARISTGRENVARHEWAREIRKRIFETGDSIRYYIGPEYTPADLYVEQSNDFLWLLQPTTEIPRVVYPHEAVARCPIHGEEVRRFDAWCPWRIDPINHPYQIQCPVGGEWYPSNRYDLGDTTTGPFADTGDGFMHEGIRYFPLREYSHMVYGSVVIPTLRSLTQAYLLSGDHRYAHKASVLLARVASEYPNYGWEGDDPHLEDRFSRTYLGPWGNTHPHYTWKRGGMITDCIWESECIDALAYAYDALYDWLIEDTELILFLEDKGLPVRDGYDLREYIENYVLRAGMRALMEKWIWGNEGHHQSAAMALALVLNDVSDRRPNSIDIAGYAFYGFGQSAWMMTNGLTRDGGGYESPSYNLYNLRFVQVARHMDSFCRLRPRFFDDGGCPDVFFGPKPQALFDYFADILVQGRVFPSIGDEGAIAPPTRTIAPRDPRPLAAGDPRLAAAALYALERWPDPRYAGSATDEAGDVVAGNLWERVPEEQLRRFAQKGGPDAAGSVPVPRAASGMASQRRTGYVSDAGDISASRFLDGYGVMILEAGPAGAQTSAWLNYTSLRGHRQNDVLSIGLWHRNLDLLPDLGYPRSWEHSRQWEANSLAHNTVTVDETQPDVTSFRGMGRIFATEAGVHLAVASHDPYPSGSAPGAKPVDVYERALLMVETAASDHYLVDLFLVRGGEQQDQSWHGMMVPVESPPLEWTVQPSGTLAGPDVPEFAAYTDRWGRRHDEGNFPSYLTSIRRATIDSPSRWRWQSEFPEGDLLDLTLIPLDSPLEVIEGSGRSPMWQDESLDFVIVRRCGIGDEPVRFLSVLSPGRGAPVVQSVRLLSQNPAALEIRHRAGTDIVEFSTGSRPDGSRGVLGVTVRRYQADRHPGEDDGAGPNPGRVTGGDGRNMARAGTLARTVSIGGIISGEIDGVDRESNSIACVWSSGLEKTAQPGRTMRLFNRHRSGLWQVVRTRREGDLLWIHLDRTSLAAIGPIEEVRDNILSTSAAFPFATSSFEMGMGGDHANEYRGMILECGSIRRRVSAATTAGFIFLNDAVPLDQLRAESGDALVRIYEYGRDDSLEVVRIRSDP